MFETRHHKTNTYHYGHLFKYGDDDEDMPENEEYITVYPKYSSFKQELLQKCININQFNNEYIKAQILFNSLYRKRHYSKMFIGNILSLMFYSNYDALTYDLQKTYRENINQHNTFYYFAKYLKLSVLRYGTTIKEGRTKSFYHGISKKLLLPQIVGGHRQGIKIFCPISTTTSFVVALNYTNHNNGIVIQFGGHKQSNSKAKHFPLSWLSDYASEDEHLFMYNGHGLEIQNITDPSLGCEWNSILNALKAITDCVQHLKYEKELITCNYVRNIQHILAGTRGQVIPSCIIDLCVSFHLDEKYFMNAGFVSSEQEALTNMIINHQLNKCGLSEYKSFLSLNEYTTDMINIYFGNVKHLEIDYYEKSQYPTLFTLCFQNKLEWIKMDVLNVLFPNVEEIRIRNIHLCSLTMDNILFHWNNDQNMVDRIVIKAKQNSSLTTLDAAYQFRQQFEAINFNITKYRNWLHVTKMK